MTAEVEVLMTGPVWRLNQGDTVECDRCLRQTEFCYVEGTVHDSTFEPERRLCEDCYRESIELIARQPG